MADCSWEAGGRQAAGCSSDSSDDEGMFHKLSAPSIFRKWRRQVAPVSPKSTFYECWEEGVEAPPCALPSPTSPKPLARALGKLKLNSRSVASNFKSYLSHRSGQAETDGEAGGRTNGFPASPPPSWRPLQKSVSSGAALTAFTQVAQDYKYPYAIPKKPSGPRDMAAALRGGTGTLNIKMDQPRQQYL
ncbi:hypothetical protein GWK47_025458 [Chionoecetes opilio]|uniref:Uncharacterized protein n=1 Tax=Chionoecetes opilio TaxID=41210 RepID=A0A8J8WDR9_CHIOP|nr:hypothetical protein GWK47_025458 [Chionoecetes opilio]